MRALQQRTRLREKRLASSYFLANPLFIHGGGTDWYCQFQYRQNSDQTIHHIMEFIKPSILGTHGIYHHRLPPLQGKAYC